MVPSPPRRPFSPVRTSPAADLSDEELNRYILTRLRLAGVSLDPLPERDPDAPADRERVLNSARSLLRGGAAALSALELDPQDWPPLLYPASLPPVEER
jgi:hypothetical protein